MKRFALFSCSDKKDLVPLANFFLDRHYDILSTGGTFNYLQSNLTKRKTRILNVGEITKVPELFDGRVKTLHPSIHGGILADRNNFKHNQTLEQNNFPLIDIVVSNLYPFEKVSKKYLSTPTTQLSFDKIIENIDIGGVALTRAAGKNHKHVTVITDPNQYNNIIRNFDNFTTTDRLNLALEAFKITSNYDKNIAETFETLNNLNNLEAKKKLISKQIVNTLTRKYTKQFDLKYGTNPHQILNNKVSGASVYSINDRKFPFKFLNGKVSYINMLDAINSWQLVNELKNQFGGEAAASFKHTSPAGAAIYSSQFKQPDQQPSDSEKAYRRAWNGDPMSSFGNFIAISGVVDESLAKYICTQVSDGIIAQSYTPDALNLLKKKKKGNYVILQGEYPMDVPLIEFREMYGVSISQPVNKVNIDVNDLSCTNRITHKKTLTTNEHNDLLMANICIKYAQSNNISLVKNGQLIGMSAGQQSRIHSVRLSIHKAKVWLLRNDPKIEELFDNELEKNIKSQERINILIRLIEHCLGDELTIQEKKQYKTFFKGMIPDYKLVNIINHYDWSSSKISMASDGFFPFRDNIDSAAVLVTAIIQPGGSIRDDEIIEACNEYGIVMVCHGKRMFTH